MIWLKEYNDPQSVIDLLSECMYPGEEKIAREFEAYILDPARSLLGWTENRELVGLIGFELLADNAIEIKHIAVKPGHRKQGLGKRMIMELMDENSVTRIEAETDKDAVDFYRSLGFQIRSLGEKYPGVERFECIFKKN